MTTILTSTRIEPVVRSGAELILARIERFGRLQKRIAVGLTGGRSVVPLLRAIVESASGTSATAWSRTEFFLVDERLVPDTHEESNFRVLQEHFFRPLESLGLITSRQCHSLGMGPDGPALAVQRYETAMNEVSPHFDVAVVGVGEDGHIGALFPNRDIVHERRTGFATLFDSPKPPPGRMSATAPMLKSSRSIFALFFGEAKRDAFHRFRNEELAWESCPAKLVNSVDDAFVLTDLA